MTDIPKEAPRSILFQFVIFPLGIVLVAVGIFFLFGKLATEEHTIPDYLNTIRSGSSHERWQAAYQLSKSLKRGEAARYPNLEQDVASIYVQSKTDDPRIRRYLSMVLGNLGDRRATPLLLDGLNDRDADNRIYVLMALGELRDPHVWSAPGRALTRPVDSATVHLDSSTIQEVQMARSLIENLTEDFHPEEFRDEYREALMGVIEKKAAGEEIEVVQAPEETKVVDLMEALKASVEATRKRASAAPKASSGRTKKAATG